MEIIPSILEFTLAGFLEKLRRTERLFPFIQVDVMDGKFVETKSFAEVDELTNLETPLKFELHLMVEDPIAELKKWEDNEKIFRVLFPIEVGDTEKIIKYIRDHGWQVGLVLNPDTPLEAAAPYFTLVDLALFMTVYPGIQGQPFVEKVLEKIKTFTALPNRPLCGVDGAVNTKTIKKLQEAGADIVYPGSALVKSGDIKGAFEKLKLSL